MAISSIDLEARRPTIDTLGLRSEIPYDSLILATGGDQSYVGHAEFAREAPGMKTIDDALELRARIFGTFGMAEREPDPDVQTLVIDARRAMPKASLRRERVD